jgi:hypothetical protein
MLSLDVAMWLSCLAYFSPAVSASIFQKWTFRNFLMGL